MRRNRRFPIGASLVLGVVLIGPAAARAQLFPDVTIKRQRPCFAQEDPRYRIIREQYFGYYPTCWRRFPPGWGCPSPEAPNWAKALQEIPLQPQAEAGAAPAPGEEGFDPFAIPGQRRDGAVPGGQPNLPLPEDIDPFQINPQPPAAPGAQPGNAPAPAGGTEPPAPGLRNPLSLPPAGGSDDLSLPRAGVNLPTTPTDVSAAPGAPPVEVAAAPEAPAVEAPAAVVSAAPDAPVAEAPASPAPSLETSGALAPAAPETGLELPPPSSPVIPTPDLGGLSSDLLPTAPPLAPPSVDAASVPLTLAPSAMPGPITNGPGPELTPVVSDPAGHHHHKPPRRGILARFFGRSRQR